MMSVSQIEAFVARLKREFEEAERLDGPELKVAMAALEARLSDAGQQMSDLQEEADAASTAAYHASVELGRLESDASDYANADDDDEEMSDHRPLAVKGAHGVYR